MPIPLKKLKDRLHALEQFASLADHYRAVIADMEAQGDDVEPQPSPGRIIDDAIADILDANGSKLHYREIFQRLQTKGIHVPGKNPASNTGAHLSLDSRFVKRGDGMWGLSKWEEEQEQEQEQAEDAFDRLLDDSRSLATER